VREALIALEVEGLVEARIGSGIYVQGPAGKAGGDEPPAVHAEAGPFELLRARYVIEGECAALAAKSAKKAQIAAIEDDGRDAAQFDGQVQPLSGDQLFHIRIAEATGNGALVAVVKMLREERTGPLYKQLEHHYDAGALDCGDERARGCGEGDRRPRCWARARRRSASEPGLQALLHRVAQPTDPRLEDTMLACSIHAKEDLRVETAKTPDVGPGECWCASAQADLRVRPPLLLRGQERQLRDSRAAIPGHEAFGVVAAVGAGVTRVKAGDKIAVSPSHACGRCDYCRQGREQLCVNMKFRQCQPLPARAGMFQEYFVMGERQCYPVAGDVSLGELAFAERSPSRCAVHRASDLLGKSVLITGAGTIGCLSVIAARSRALPR
jgi:hypothetical protein